MEDNNSNLLLIFFRFSSRPIIPEGLDPLVGCLCDYYGNPLRADSGGTQFCYQALPHYKTIVLERKNKFEPNELITDSHRRLLNEENQPIPVANEHELAQLYLDEKYSRLGVCDIFQLDLEAVLRIMAKSSCFSTSAQQAVLATISIKATISDNERQ